MAVCNFKASSRILKGLMDPSNLLPISELESGEQRLSNAWVSNFTAYGGITSGNWSKEVYYGFCLAEFKILEKNSSAIQDGPASIIWWDSS